jgi:hypothetical protein
VTARKPHNGMHVIRYMRRSGLSGWAQALLAQLACDTNGAARLCEATSRDLADDLCTSVRQVERALSELRERGIVVSVGAGRARKLAIREESIAPGYPARTPPPVAEMTPPPVAGLKSEPRQNPATGGGAPTYMDQKILQTSGQTSVDGAPRAGGAGEEENDPAPLLERETRAERRARWSTAEGVDGSPRSSSDGSDSLPRKLPDRTSRGSGALAQGRSTPPPTPAPPPAGPPGHARVLGAQESTDPLSVLELAELAALEVDANPERLVDPPRIHRLLLARARAEGWTLEELRALWLDACSWNLRSMTWSTVFAGGWDRKRTQLLERLRAAPRTAPRAPAVRWDQMTPAEVEARVLALARQDRERLIREEEEDNLRRRREAVRRAAK